MLGYNIPGLFMREAGTRIMIVFASVRFYGTVKFQVRARKLTAWYKDRLSSDLSSDPEDVEPFSLELQVEIHGSHHPLISYHPDCNLQLRRERYKYL
jgi:hypothetical protein